MESMDGAVFHRVLHPSLRGQRGAVFTELCIAVPVFIAILGLLLAVAAPLNLRAGGIAAARDLSRYGAGYNFSAPRTDGQPGVKSACEVVCERATQVLCSRGLDASKYQVSTSFDGDSFSVNVRREGVAFLSYFATDSDNSNVAFLLEDIAVQNWDWRGCGSCTTGSCSDEAV